MRARRLACRCWAGRVALRENRAHQHHPAGPRGSEAAAEDKPLKIKPESSGQAGLRCSLCLACAPSAPDAALLGTARLWRGILPSTHLAREGRMTVTIGRRELLAALGGVAARGARAEPAMPVVGFAFALGRALDSISALSARTRELGNSNGYPQKFASCLFSTNFVQPVRQCRMVTECENDQDHCSIPARWERYNTGSPTC